MSNDGLADFVEATIQRYAVPGAAVGVWANGQVTYACHGVTSVANPLPVDQDTLYVLGSVTKTYTATTLMRLADSGRIRLDAPVRRYVPELALADERAAAEVTVMNLLNHTSGLDWGLITDTGEGDDALATYVARMGELDQVAPIGARASYSQAGYNLAGRVVEKVTGMTFERAVASLVLEPLGLRHSFFARDEIMTRRFCAGHNLGEDGILSIARLWRRSRGDNPGGGLVSSASDQLRWARFHLGDGRIGNDNARMLSTDGLHRMKEPTVALQASSLGDAIGIGWFLRDVDGVRTVGHAGSANGQFAEVLMVPERKFAVVTMSNAGPDNGLAFNQAVVRWALENYVGVRDRDPEPLPNDPARAAEVVGSYENEVMTLTVESVGESLQLDVRIKPEIRAEAETELPPDLPPANLGLLPGGADEYIVTAGGLAGQRGFFTRDQTGTVVGVDLAGRLFNRVGTTA
jgi:CubicO group peptidase (beta-lactamase class C family)